MGRGSAHTETWYAGPDWEVILRKSPSGNSLRAVCLRCFSSPTLLHRPPHNNLKSCSGWKRTERFNNIQRHFAMCAACQVAQQNALQSGYNQYNFVRSFNVMYFKVAVTDFSRQAVKNNTDAADRELCVWQTDKCKFIIHAQFSSDLVSTNFYGIELASQLALCSAASS